MIVAIANSKGGVGKSTLAVHLAAWLEENGQHVTLVDCDAQQSSSEWIREAFSEITTVCLNTPDTILNALPALAQQTEYLIADGPGSNSEISRALLLRADLALVPCKASMLEVRALSKATEVIAQARDIRSGEPQARIILSMVREQHRLTQDMKEAAAALGFELAGSQLTLRQIYADAPGQGTVVWRMQSHDPLARTKATTELETLFRELFPKTVKKRRLKACASLRRNSTPLSAWSSHE